MGRPVEVLRRATVTLDVTKLCKTVSRILSLSASNLERVNSFFSYSRLARYGSRYTHTT